MLRFPRLPASRTLVPPCEATQRLTELLLFTDGFVAGPALVGARVFQPHQYSVGGQLAGT